MVKALVDKLIAESAAYVNKDLQKKPVWALRVCLIILDNLEVDVFNFVYSDCTEYKNLALRVAEGAG